MKVILTGIAGFVGSEVLAQCREDPTITSIIALTRRILPEEITKDPKVEVIVMEDFNVYPEEVIKKLEGADACIWYVDLMVLLRIRLQDFLYDGAVPTPVAFRALAQRC